MGREVGIVGYGRCGRLAAEVLARERPVIVTDARDLAARAEAAGAPWGDLAAVASRPVVLLAVPIRSLPQTLDAVVPHLAPDALVVDLASVKDRPMAWMADRLPPGIGRVGTHPLFGPDSVREDGLAGQRIVVTPAAGHEAAAERVADAARGLGLTPIVTSPEAHDRAMARSQALVFLLARALRSADLGISDLGTPSERRVADALRTVDADSRELYEDILTLNPWARDAATSLREALADEVDRLFD